MGECNLGGATVEYAGMVRGGRRRAVYANNAPLRARSGVEVERRVENYQDQFELILIWFMQRRDGDGSGTCKQQHRHNASWPGVCSLQGCDARRCRTREREREREREST